MTDSPRSPVTFQRLGLGREAVVLGRVQVGEIMEIEGDRGGACFRLNLPEASTTSWRPVRDRDEARRLSRGQVSDWIEAAGLRPVRAKG
ncbi:hypothetical protein RPPS3_25520 [Rhodopseudomonas palustris]|uniref:hypothetical protein n=1 Tax=Rhodopseudomonas palustris TaxID=1076 RepID=UPI000D19EFE7|nr:hypothetical protein [Rhodopseudomonas palustris]AVT76615.1 hypothetical protein RPPS3_25520 [Rhodopseudomonas palustris]